MRIKSIIEAVDDGRHRARSTDVIEGIMVHRVGVDRRTGVVLGYCAQSICDAFLGRVPQWHKVAKVTGGENAYTLLIGGDLGAAEYDGQIWQALPLDEVGHHARRFSAPYLGVGCIGDFRERHGAAPSSLQWSALVSVISDLCLALDLRAGQVVGHGELPGAHGGDKASGRPAACPGGLLDLDELRVSVGGLMRAASQGAARSRLSGAGMVLP